MVNRQWSWNTHILSSTRSGTRHRFLDKHQESKITLNPPRRRERAPHLKGSHPACRDISSLLAQITLVEGRVVVLYKSVRSSTGNSFNMFLFSVQLSLHLTHPPHLLVTLTRSWKRRSISCHCSRNKEGQTLLSQMKNYIKGRKW